MNTCKISPRKPGSNGYTSRTVKGIQYKEIRYVWEQVNKKRIPLGFVVRHTCDTPTCINPDHLIIGTHQDNMNDRAARGRTATKEKHGMRKITRDIALEIRSIGWAVPQRIIAKVYNISQTQVGHILRNVHWRNI